MQDTETELAICGSKDDAVVVDTRAEKAHHPARFTAGKGWGDQC